MKNNNLFKFIFYTLTVFSISFLFIAKTTIKNECIKTKSAIEKLNNRFISNKDIVKQLQSKKSYLESHDYVEKYLSDRMIAAIPETLIINIENKQ
tara:strand:- start:190 stop:474 length:285 start_codon:yes stop_codon:yes gene_type:complete